MKECLRPCQIGVFVHMIRYVQSSLECPFLPLPCCVPVAAVGTMVPVRAGSMTLFGFFEFVG